MAKEKLGGFALWGAIVGVIGGLLGIVGGGLSLYDRFFPPSIEVLGVRPVYIRGAQVFGSGKDREEIPRRGVSFVVHVRSQGRSVSITGMRIVGKLFLT